MTSLKIVRYIQSHASELQDLPPANETWTADDVRDQLDIAVQALFEHDIIECVGQTDGKDPANIYRVPRQTREKIREVANNDLPRLPCGHVGFVTASTDGSGEYKCSTKGCDATFDRPTLEAVYETRDGGVKA